MMATLTVQEIEDAPDDIKNVVFGYVRRIKLSNNNSIPTDIILLCFAFFYEKTKWSTDLVGKLLQLKENNIMAIANEPPYEDFSSAYLEPAVKKGVGRWKFKIIKSQQGKKALGTWYIMMGIVKNRQNGLTVDDHFGRKANTSYVFIANAGRIDNPDHPFDGDYKKYGVPCDENDEIEMILDLNALELRFNINGTDYGKAFDVEQDEYRAAICMFCDDDAIQLLL